MQPHPAHAQQPAYQQPAASPAPVAQAPVAPAASPAPVAQAPVAPAASPAPVAQATPQSSGTGEFTWLQSGENVRMKVTGLLGFSSPNPILRMIMSIGDLFMAICGFRKKAALVVTNRRVVLDTRAYSLWVLEKGSDSTTIFKADMITTGYNSSLFIFKKRYISVDGIQIGVKRSFSQSDLEEMAKMINEVLK